MFVKRRLRCSFCRLSEHEVDKLVAGPRVYICDRCVAIAVDLMRREASPAAPAARRSLMWRLRRRLQALRSTEVHLADLA